jgi:hypothetical protein
MAEENGFERQRYAYERAVAGLRRSGASGSILRCSTGWHDAARVLHLCFVAHSEEDVFSQQMYE